MSAKMWEKWSFVFESNAAKYYWAVPEKELQAPLAFQASQKSVYVPCTAITLEGQIPFVRLPTDRDIEAEDIGWSALVERCMMQLIKHRRALPWPACLTTICRRRGATGIQSVQGMCWWANNSRFSWSPLTWVMSHLWASLVWWSAYLEIQD